MFPLAVLALIASPGPDFFYVLGRGMAQGPRAGLLSAVGISLGLCVHTTLAVLGLSALVATSPTLFFALKIAGALYLILMGVKMLRSTTSESEVMAPLNQGAVVRQAVLTNVLNPKAALTFLAFLPAWVRPGTQAPSISLQLGLLGATTVGLALAWFSLVGLSAARIGTLLKRRPGVEAWVNRAMGVLLIVLGFALALQKQ